MVSFNVYKVLLSHFVLCLALPQWVHAQESCVKLNPLYEQQKRDSDDTLSIASDGPSGDMRIESVSMSGVFEIRLAPDGLVKQISPLKSATYLSRKFESVVPKLKKNPNGGAFLLNNFEAEDAGAVKEILNHDFPGATEFPYPVSRSHLMAKDRKPSPYAAVIHRMKQVVDRVRKDLSCPSLKAGANTSSGRGTETQSASGSAPAAVAR